MAQKRPIAMRDPVTSLFFPDELALVDEVISDLRGQNAANVSLRSHDIRWKAVSLGDPIPYEFIYLDAREMTQDDISRSHELARELGWN